MRTYPLPVQHSDATLSASTRLGSIFVEAMSTRTLTERREAFLLRVMPEPNTGCWMWMGNINNSGYAQCSKDLVGTVAAARTAYKLFISDIASGMEVDHTCSMRSCVNPMHLRSVTHAENMRARGGVAMRGILDSSRRWQRKPWPNRRGFAFHTFTTSATGIRSIQEGATARSLGNAGASL